jgi:hypothetical protein
LTGSGRPVVLGVPVVAIAEAVPQVPLNGPVLFIELTLSGRGSVISLIIEHSGTRASIGIDVQDLSMPCGFLKLIPSKGRLNAKILVQSRHQVGTIAAQSVSSQSRFFLYGTS